MGIRSPPARSRRQTPVCLVICVASIIVLLSPSLMKLLGFGGDEHDGVKRLTAGNWRPVTSMYASLWAHELKLDFAITPRRVKDAEEKAAQNGKNFTSVIGMLKKNGFDLIVTSVLWNDTEPSDGVLQLDGLSRVVDVVCNLHQLRLSIVVDVGLPPYWLYTQFPDAQSKDSFNRTYNYMAVGHSLAVARSYVFIAGIADHVRRIAPPGCLHSMQPNWNNEYEAKYTQEHDCFQDYSPLFQWQYRNFFSLLNSSLKFWNKRWNTNFSSWADVQPPVYWQGAQTPDTTAVYHDYLKFRERLGAQVILGACALLKQKDVDCILHIPELYSATDPIYQASMFWTLAKSPVVRYLVMDTSFTTAWGTQNNLAVGQFMVAIAKAYPSKFVYFEVAYEKFHESMGGGLQKALEAGVDGLGYTNWYGRVAGNVLKPPGAIGASRTLTCDAPVTKAFVVPHEISATVRGLNFTAVNKDPVQQHVLETFAQHAGGCGNGGVHVFGDIEHFEDRAARYTSVINVLSPVLYASTQRRLGRVMEAARQHHIVLRTIEVPQSLQDLKLPTIPTILDDLVLAESVP